MVAPFQDDLDGAGAAGFVRVLADDDGYRAALLVVTPRGEPLDLSYAVDDSADGRAVGRLVGAVVEACPRALSVLLCLGDEVSAAALPSTTPAARIAGENVEWMGSPTPAASALVERLERTGLLREPFARAASGLRLVLEPAPA